MHLNQQEGFVVVLLSLMLIIIIINEKDQWTICYEARMYERKEAATFLFVILFNSDSNYSSQCASSSLHYVLLPKLTKRDWPWFLCGNIWGDSMTYHDMTPFRTQEHTAGVESLVLCVISLESTWCNQRTIRNYFRERI